eukprot:comp11643_c0_seq1/m.6147 comp11643_c0_seq1/g.6147  ORF comp11643_c0_seq1/g.6147 comp11643_c0_seq1/m.6147 type:complete len:144 (-) comp11643_c0_seq1:143-574(-)
MAGQTRRWSALAFFIFLALCLISQAAAEHNYFACKCVFQGNVTINDVDDESQCSCEVQFPHAGADPSQCHCEHEDRSTFLIKSVVLGLVTVYVALGILLALGPVLKKYYPRVHNDQAYLSSRGIQQPPRWWQKILDTLCLLQN